MKEILYPGQSKYNRYKRNLKKSILIPKNIFNYFHEKRLKKLQEFPESFSIETVNICNAKCWFCPQPDHKRQKGYMHFDIYKKNECYPYRWIWGNNV